MTKQIPLTQGKFALIDDADAERASQFKWYTQRNGDHYYAFTKPGGKPLSLHRFLMSAKPGEWIDHINNNGLDCQRSNMRLCTHAQNMRNRKIHRTNRSGYKGVDWHNSMWRAKLRVDNQNIELGYYRDVRDAARAYNRAALKYHAEFARLNDLPDLPDEVMDGYDKKAHDILLEFPPFHNFSEKRTAIGNALRETAINERNRCVELIRRFAKIENESQLEELLKAITQ